MALLTCDFFSDALQLGCGDEDPLLDYTTGFAETATAAGHDLTVDLRSGAHEWSFWDAEIQRVIAWLPLPNRSSEDRSR